MSTGRPRIVVAEAYAPVAIERLRQYGDVVLLNKPSAPELMAALTDADALLVRTYVHVTEELLSAAPRLRVIGRGGVGIDNIDVEAARQRGIAVVYTPAASTRSVAEHTIGLMLALTHQMIAGHAAVRSGDFHRFRGTVRFPEMHGATLGIIGMGRIGSLVGRIAALGLGMRVLYNDIVPVGPFEYAAESCDKAMLFKRADVVTLHVPLTPDTHRLMNAQALAALQPHAVLINTSRGPVVDADALAAALAAGRLGGAALDVFDPEPLPAGHALFSAPHVLLSPHMASRSGPGLEAVNTVVEDIIAVLEGRPPQYPA
jgi:D-3-phosphoglycerate dehydrogenase